MLDSLSAPDSSNSLKKPRKKRVAPATWIDGFLKAIEGGASIGSASRLNGICRTTHTARLESDKVYADRYRDAVANFIDGIEDRVVIQAVRPDADPKLLLRILEVRRPEVWGTKTKIDLNANHSGAIGGPADDALYAYANMIGALKAEVGMLQGKLKENGIAYAAPDQAANESSENASDS